MIRSLLELAARLEKDGGSAQNYKINKLRNSAGDQIIISPTVSPHLCLFGMIPAGFHPLCHTHQKTRKISP